MYRSRGKDDIKKFIDYLSLYEDYNAHTENKIEDLEEGELLVYRINKFSYFLVLHRFQKENKKTMVLKIYKIFKHFEECGVFPETVDVLSATEEIDILDATKEISRNLDLPIYTWDKEIFFDCRGDVQFKSNKDLKKLRSELMEHINKKTLFIPEKRTKKFLLNSLKAPISSFRFIFRKDEKRIAFLFIGFLSNYWIKKVRNFKFIPSYEIDEEKR